MALRIESQRMQIGIKTSPAIVQIKSTPDKLQMKQNHGKIQMNTTHPKIEIDQYPSFSTVGLKNMYDLTKENGQIARSAVMEYIQKKTQDGDDFSKIEQKKDVIVEIALRESVDEKKVELGFLPQDRPKIRIIEGEVQVEAIQHPAKHTNGVEIEVSKGSLEMNVQHGQIEIYELQKAWIRFSYIEGKDIDIRT